LVSQQLVPQMSDSALVYQGITLDPQVQYVMLIVNKQGLNTVFELSVKRIAVFCAASDAFSQHNIHCNIDQNLITLQSICEQALNAGVSIRAYISCVLGCPFQGKVEINKVIRVAEKLYQFGCDEISLGDTIGIGTAGQVKTLLDNISQSLPIEHIAVHFHDSYGQAMANILMALQSGVRIIDSSVSGLGGCPFAPGSSGNVATEDVVFLLNGLGIETGVDLEKLISTSWCISKALGRSPRSALAHIYNPNNKS
jgi:isopropylmalate/homocitrate/citramalate synthase